MSKIQLSSIEQFEDVIQKEASFLVIKHSLTCPISQEAFNEYNKFAQNSECSTYFLYVQEARPLSNYIAEKYEIKHESPQALLFVDGQVKWNASHWNITESKLKQAIEA